MGSSRTQHEECARAGNGCAANSKTDQRGRASATSNCWKHVPILNRAANFQVSSTACPNLGTEKVLRHMSRISEAVILIAGQGSRLRGADKKCLKPFVPVLGRPLLAYTLEAVSSAGTVSYTHL